MNEVVDRLQESFDEKFSRFRSVPIGIYGIGKNAGTIAENIKGYDFACLIATDHLHETKYGLKVLSLSEALEGIEFIIIAAIPSSTAIIYERIKDEVPDDIPIYNMHGDPLKGDDNYKNDKYWNCSLQDLLNAIDLHEVISFDIFDTLLMRRVLKPRDVFGLVEERLGSGMFSGGFKVARVQTEEKLYESHVSPTIVQIYDQMAADNGLGRAELNRAQDMELEAEINAAIPRYKMKESLDYALNKGKKVFFTSDMYFGEADIRRILDHAGIYAPCEILVSCEHNASKYKGTLFKVLKETAGTSSILHIGDDEENDVRKAQEIGIDTFHIKKGYDILAGSSAAFIYNRVNNASDERMLGYLISEMFNDPFVLNNSKGKLIVNSYRDIALRILPVTLVYLSYIIKNASKYDTLMFASRDGYFLHRMYEKFRSSNSDLNLPGGKYIYMSRSAVSGAAVMSAEDIRVLSNKIVDDPKLNLKEFYRTQFHIMLPEEFNLANREALDKWGVDGLNEKLKVYDNDILAFSESERDRYRAYLRTTGSEDCSHPAIVDIVTQGTLVYGIERIMNKEIGLIAMGTSCVPNRYIDGSDVDSLYGNITERIGDAIHSMSDFSETHLLLEMLYGSIDGQLSGFDNEGAPVFAEGTEYNRELIVGVQDELEKLIDEAMNMKLFGKVSKEFASDVLRLCKRKYSCYAGEIVSAFSFNDPYDGSLKDRNLIDYIS